MSSILFEVKPTDPLTFGGVALLLCAIALAGMLHSGAPRRVGGSNAGAAIGVAVSGP